MGTALLAHQGGWDEALMVLVPVAILAAILVLATRRAKAIQSRRTQASADAASDPSTDTATGDEEG